jgi:hypothetical protein
MLECLIACQVQQPLASHVRALVGLSPSTPAARPIGNQIRSITPRSASRHPSQFPEAHRPAASGPGARVSGTQPRQSPPGGRYGPRPARSTTRPAGPESERIRYAEQSITSQSPSPPAGPAPGPSALYCATGCSWIRSRPRPAPPAPANKSVPHGCNRVAVSLAADSRAIRVSAPRHTGRQSPRVRLGEPCCVQCVGPNRLSSRAERPATQPSKSQRARGHHPTSQRHGPSPHARPSALHRATASARVPIPTQARSSATGAAALANTSGSGRKGAVEAIRDFIPQPPGCRQGTSLAPVAAWQLLPSSKKGVAPLA